MSGTGHIMNWETERAVLGGILLAPERLDDVREHLTPGHFHRPAHQRIYALMCDLADKGTPPDTILVLDAIEARGEAEPCGGIGYVIALPQACASVDHVASYARQVANLATLRKLQLMARTIEEMVTAGQVDAAQAMDAASALLYGVVDGVVGGKGWVPIADTLHRQLEEIRERAENPSECRGFRTGLVDLDKKIGGLERGRFYVIAGRPAMGKSAFAQGIAQYVARSCGVGFITLEMPDTEIAERALVMEGHVGAGKVRDGKIDSDDWRRMIDAAERLAVLPIWIDDSPAASIAQIRAKARRLKAQHPELGVLFLDYAQLATADVGRGNREQEVAKIARGGKAIAKELGIAVVFLAQLSRKCEDRTDRRPTNSDLRECVTGDQLVVDPTTGDRVMVRDIAVRGRAAVASLRDGWRIGPASASLAWSVGVRPVVRMTTAAGRELRCTRGHRVRGIDGWIEVGDLTIGERIATPRALSLAFASDAFTSDEARLLGYLISDGSYLKHRACSYAKADPVLIQDVTDIVRSRFGIEPRVKAQRGKATELDLSMRTTGPNKNPLIQWLKALGLHDQRGEVKRVPSGIFRSSDALIAEFIGALWAGDGCVVPKKAGGWQLKFASTSIGLCRDLQHLLLRVGILGSISAPEQKNDRCRPIWTVSVTDADQVRAFACRIPMRGIKGERLKEAGAYQWLRPANHRQDRLPLVITSRVDKRRRNAGLSHADLGYRCQGKEMCRRDLAQVAEKLGAPDLAALATSDLLWDEVVSIEDDGEEEVFDLTVPGPENFVVSDIVTHNSGAIEQDADVILFIYRDSVYNKDSPDQGIAEIIVGKNRAGTTGTVKVAFIGEQVRFANLATDTTRTYNEQDRGGQW